jgi:TonB family protein
LRSNEYIPGFFISVALHGALLLFIVGYGTVAGCKSSRQEEILPIEFTVAVESSPDAPLELPDDPGPEEPIPDDPPAPDIPPPPDDIPPPPPPPPEPDPIPEPVKEPPKEPPKESRKEPPKESRKKPIEKGRRVVRGPKNTPAIPTSLSNEELARRLKAGARPGQRDTLEPGEQQRNFLLIKRAFYDAWERPPRGDGARPVVARITFDSFGNITGRSIETSSGNAEIDRSVRDAMSRVRRVDNLSAKFLARQKSVSIEFTVE